MSTTPAQLQKPILRDPPVITPSMRARDNSVRLVRALRDGANGPLSITDARRLMKADAEEIERLQQLPLFP